MTQNTRIHNRFEYHLEDLDCLYCRFYQQKNKYHKTGCGLDICRFDDIRLDAAIHGRLLRKPGWFKCRR